MGVRVSIAGASGYAGGEVLPLVLAHPDLELAAICAGSSPVTCAAALAVLDTIESDDLLTRVTDVGLRWALLLTTPLAGNAESAARDADFLVNVVRPDVIRLAPPLILTLAEADSFTKALPGILDAAADAGEQG